MMKFLIALVVQALIVMFIFPIIDPNFKARGNIQSSLLVVLIFIVLNFLIRWFFLLFTFGLAGVFYLLTFGLVGLIVNAVVLLLISKMFPGLISVPGFFSALVGGALLALVNVVVK
jgi:putative membrane protein